MPVGIEAWITQIPPITRGWLALSVLTSLAVVRSSITETHIVLIRFVITAMPPSYDSPTIL